MLIFCRWRRLSTLVKSAVEKQQLSHINSANCPGINISGCIRVRYSTDLTHQCFSPLVAAECSSYT